MTKINPAWAAYNNLQNEGEEGYNPHPKFVTARAVVAPAAVKPVADRFVKDPCNRGNNIRASALQRLLDADIALLPKLTNASAIALCENDIAKRRAALLA